MALTRVGFSASTTELLCDELPVAEIAAAAGTPLYIYSGASIREAYRALDRAFGSYPHRIHYALKANSTLALVRLLREEGAAADVNSIWELEVARRAGYVPADIVFTGVGKSPAELECSLPLGLKAINVESAGELARLEHLAARAQTVVRVAVRVNPDIDAKSHPHISTGLKINKFGIPADAARDLIATLTHRPHLRLVAVHVHVGSQITTVAPLRAAASFLCRFAEELLDRGMPIEYVDLGGGLGISYDGQEVPSPDEYVSALVDEGRRIGLPVVIEPGRAIVGPAGALVSTVIDVKPRTATSDFVVLDAGMTELMRPALYDAFHPIEPVRVRAGDRRAYELVGPVCESSDVVGRDRLLPPVEVGDLVAIGGAGAYGAAMASNYNRRPLPVEVLVDQGRWRVIRRRQTVDDLLSLES